MAPAYMMVKTFKVTILQLPVLLELSVSLLKNLDDFFIIL